MERLLAWVRDLDVRLHDGAASWFREQGCGPVEAVMSDNHKAYTSTAFTGLLDQLGARQILTPAYTPRWNGKIECFFGTARREWSHSRTWPNSATRDRALASYMRFHNRRRPHSAAGAGLPSPASSKSAGRTASPGPRPLDQSPPRAVDAHGGVVWAAIAMGRSGAARRGGKPGGPALSHRDTSAGEGRLLRIDDDAQPPSGALRKRLGRQARSGTVKGSQCALDLSLAVLQQRLQANRRGFDVESDALHAIVLDEHVGLVGVDVVDDVAPKTPLDIESVRAARSAMSPVAHCGEEGEAPWADVVPLYPCGRDGDDRASGEG